MPVRSALSLATTGIRWSITTSIVRDYHEFNPPPYCQECWQKVLPAIYVRSRRIACTHGVRAIAVMSRIFWDADGQQQIELPYLRVT